MAPPGGKFPAAAAARPIRRRQRGIDALSIDVKIDVNGIQAVVDCELPRTIACAAGYGAGGLGQHFAQLVDDFRASGALDRYYAPSIRPGDEGAGHVVQDNLAPKLIGRTPLRFSPGWMNYVSGELYDRAVAAQLTARPVVYVSFGGQALQSFQKARQLGCRR